MAGNKYDDDDAQGSIDARKVVAQSRILLMYAIRAPWIASCTGGSGTMVIWLPHSCITMSVETVASIHHVGAYRYVDG